MGWKGTIRSMGAAARRAERAAVRRQKELERQRKQYERMAALEQAEHEAQEYANYIDVLRSIQRDCGPFWDWRRIAEAPPPPEPFPTRARAAEAEAALEAFRPGLLDRLLGRVERRLEELRAAIPRAAAQDSTEHREALRGHEKRRAEWAESQQLAHAILAGNAEAWLTALEQSGVFDEIDALGSRIVFGIHESGPPEAEIHVNTDEVIPLPATGWSG